MSAFARAGDMWPIDTQRFRFVCSDTSRAPGEDLLEVPLREALALRDHAEAMRAGGLGRARVLEDLLRVHHRVHGRVGLREARLRAEATVLRAAARLRVHERAHVRGVAEAILAHPPSTLDQRLDLGTIGDLAEPQRLFPGDEGRHGGPR